MSKFKGVKTKNTKLSNAKEKIRLRVLKSSCNNNVLELYCGSGVMFKKVWNNADNYTGVDIVKYNYKNRTTVQCDVVKYVKTNDLSLYNVFDIDAYGSPYKSLEIILNKIKETFKTGKISFCITDGVQMDLRMGNITKSMARLAGIKSIKTNGVHLIHDILIKKIIINTAKKLRTKVIDSSMCKGSTGSGMRYYMFIVEKA